MDLGFRVNGVPLEPGSLAVDGQLREAGLCRLSFWRRLTRRLPGDRAYWEAADPLVECFADQLSIYPCLDGYLTPDRRWHTHCMVLAAPEQITGIEVQVIHGIYAAGNLYDRFLDAGREHLGTPSDEGRGVTVWKRDGCLVTARYDDQQFNASFRVEVVPGWTRGELPRASAAGTPPHPVHR
jgi:hypothetical protein